MHFVARSTLHSIIPRLILEKPINAFQYLGLWELHSAQNYTSIFPSFHVISGAAAKVLFRRQEN